MLQRGKSVNLELGDDIKMLTSCSFHPCKQTLIPLGRLSMKKTLRAKRDQRLWKSTTGKGAYFEFWVDEVYHPLQPEAATQT